MRSWAADLPSPSHAQSPGRVGGKRPFGTLKAQAPDPCTDPRGVRPWQTDFSRPQFSQLENGCGGFLVQGSGETGVLARAGVHCLAVELFSPSFLKRRATQPRPQPLPAQPCAVLAGWNSSCHDPPKTGRRGGCSRPLPHLHHTPTQGPLFPPLPPGCCPPSASCIKDWNSCWLWTGRTGQVKGVVCQAQ
jgi:hypothetical protein